MQKKLKKNLIKPHAAYYFPAGVNKLIALQAMNSARLSLRTQNELYCICTDIMRIAYDGFWTTNHGFGFWFDYSDYLPNKFKK